LEYDYKQIKNYFKNIQDDFGIEEQALTRFKYILKSNDIFFVDENWTDANPGIFERIGTRFGTINKDNKIIINTQAAQVLANHISKNIIELKNSNELKSYFEGGTIKTTFAQKGQSVVKYENYILGAGVFTEAGLKSQFPRSRRTQEMFLEFP